MNIKQLKKYILFLILIIPFIANAQDFYLCTRVVDGDTIIINIDGKDERVCLIEVDTPETKHLKKPIEAFGKEASAFTKYIVEGKQVRHEYDKGQKRDKNGRLLAYVYWEDNTFLNAEIIMQQQVRDYLKNPPNPLFQRGKPERRTFHPRLQNGVFKFISS